MPEMLKPVIVNDEHGTRVEIHDEFGFAGIDPTNDDIIDATEELVGAIEDNPEFTDDVSVRDTIEQYKTLVEGTKRYHDELTDIAHQGAGALTESGHFRLPRLEEIDIIDREAYFAIYWEGLPKSRMLKQKLKELHRAR